MGRSHGKVPGSVLCWMLRSPGSGFSMNLLQVFLVEKLAVTGTSQRGWTQWHIQKSWGCPGGDGHLSSFMISSSVGDGVTHWGGGQGSWSWDTSLLHSHAPGLAFPSINTGPQHKPGSLCSGETEAQLESGPGSNPVDFPAPICQVLPPGLVWVCWAEGSAGARGPRAILVTFPRECSLMHP